MFESASKKFDDYMDKIEAANPAGFNEDLAIEVRKRLQQLDYLYRDISRKHER